MDPDATLDECFIEFRWDSMWKKLSYLTGTSHNVQYSVLLGAAENSFGNFEIAWLILTVSLALIFGILKFKWQRNQIKSN